LVMASQVFPAWGFPFALCLGFLRSKIKPK
jgi:hypothetical protein